MQVSGYERGPFGLHTPASPTRPARPSGPPRRPRAGKPNGPSRLDVTFAALADPTRRAILARLAKGEASVGELAEPFAISQPAISKHLKVLELAGLISRGRQAQRRPRRLDPKPLAEVNQWLEDYRRHWETSFRELDHVLEELKALEAKSKQPKQPKKSKRSKRAKQSKKSKDSKQSKQSKPPNRPRKGKKS
jgi:DNA-binding transcriptional ArsR family regulator